MQIRKQPGRNAAVPVPVNPLRMPSGWIVPEDVASTLSELRALGASMLRDMAHSHIVKQTRALQTRLYNAREAISRQHSRGGEPYGIQAFRTLLPHIRASGAADLVHCPLGDFVPPHDPNPSASTHFSQMIGHAARTAPTEGSGRIVVLDLLHESTERFHRSDELRLEFPLERDAFLDCTLSLPDAMSSQVEVCKTAFANVRSCFAPLCMSVLRLECR